MMFVTFRFTSDQNVMISQDEPMKSIGLHNHNNILQITESQSEDCMKNVMEGDVIRKYGNMLNCNGSILCE